MTATCVADAVDFAGIEAATSCPPSTYGTCTCNCYTPIYKCKDNGPHCGEESDGCHWFCGGVN